MIYKFITDQNLDVGMKTYFRNQVIENNPHILTTSEGAAVSMMKAKLSGRYDLTKLFPEIKTWNNTVLYKKDQYCFKSDKIYKALQDGTGNDPVTQPAYWIEEDPRDDLLIVFCVDITIYTMCKPLPAIKTPTDLVDAYMAAMQWLEDCQKGLENPDWPVLEDGASTINWGSNEKLDHYY